MAGVATVFGGSGFIGRYIVKRLAREGWVVRVAVRDPEAAHFLQPLGNVGQIVRMGVPVQDEAAVRWAVDGADAVFNCFGILHESGKQQQFEELHNHGPARIAAAAAEAGVKRLVHISAIGADSRSDSLYAQSKGRGEKAVRKAFPAATILRPSLVIGPEDSFFNRFAVMARLSPALPLIGGGKTRFQPIHVEDLVPMLVAALEEDEHVGETYEIGGPETLTLRQVTDLVYEAERKGVTIVPLPMPLARIGLSVLGAVPGFPMGPDQYRSLKFDNTTADNDVAAFGVDPDELTTLGAHLGVR
jgi:NADH dehydrogenase